MVPDGKPRALFPADRDLVLLDQLADVLESHRRLMQLHLVMVGESVDQVGRGDGFRYAVFPAARFDQVIEEQRDDVVRLDECSIGIHDPKAVGVAVSRNADARAGLLHFGAHFVQQVIVGLWRVAAKQHVTDIVHGRNVDPRFAQQRIGISAGRAPERVVDHLESRFLDRREIDHFFQSRKVVRP